MNWGEYYKEPMRPQSQNNASYQGVMGTGEYV